MTNNIIKNNRVWRAYGYMVDNNDVATSLTCRHFHETRNEAKNCLSYLKLHCYKLIKNAPVGLTLVKWVGVSTFASDKSY